jgi:hypothetical protein
VKQKKNFSDSHCWLLLKLLQRQKRRECYETFSSFSLVSMREELIDESNFNRQEWSISCLTSLFQEFFFRWERLALKIVVSARSQADQKCIFFKTKWIKKRFFIFIFFKLRNLLLDISQGISISLMIFLKLNSFNLKIHRRPICFTKVRQANWFDHRIAEASWKALKKQKIKIKCWKFI